ncbi:unnamed protein product [Zymoseptoria tritici ST99CH_1E4]|uniref:Aminoglycoside phosphotransferase domain-containing protein n=1 Tax=Zymoseptoria tritici ST99CH_1E4 TaxID=1276532 RepID=A0A2H1H9E2_ZYMTR|nr:unnamed protein product [Zymoseptoria tritici ST99CH_1E4]
MTEAKIRTTKWKEVTLEQALDDDWDMIPTLTAFSQTQDFCQHLEHHRTALENIISRHLGISKADFVLLDREHWVWGSFNICLPIDITRSRRTAKLPRQAILRLPLPFRCGEKYSPGNVEEKLRCEAATYIWLRRNCPSIPIPRLLGIGIPAVEAFTAIENESLWHRFLWHIQRFRAWLQGDTLAPFFRHDRSDTLSSTHGYLLLEYVMAGDPLSSSWQKYRQHGTRRDNLYRGISRILLDLARVLQPRIGSWTLNSRGIISLTNRPLLDLTMLWNRHEIPTGIPKTLTYTSTPCYLQDLLSYQDLRLRHQPNAILGRPDAVFQLSALAALRALQPVFWKSQDSRDESFVLTLPDLHQSNIFVDDDWNIVGVIDFEFAPVQPIGIVHVPTWLTDKGVDELVGPALDEYREAHDRFLEVLQEEEESADRERASHHPSLLPRGEEAVPSPAAKHHLSSRLRQDWQTGKMWFNAALRSTNAFPLVFEQHIQPRFFDKFDPDMEGNALMRLWSEEDCEEFIAKKLRDKKGYEERVRGLFDAAGNRAQSQV